MTLPLLVVDTEVRVGLVKRVLMVVLVVEVPGMTVYKELLQPLVVRVRLAKETMVEKVEVLVLTVELVVVEVALVNLVVILPQIRVEMEETENKYPSTGRPLTMLVEVVVETMGLLTEV
jgi:hypothetical protein